MKMSRFSSTEGESYTRHQNCKSGSVHTLCFKASTKTHFPLALWPPLLRGMLIPFYIDHIIVQRKQKLRSRHAFCSQTRTDTMSSLFSRSFHYFFFASCAFFSTRACGGSPNFKNINTSFRLNASKN